MEFLAKVKIVNFRGDKRAGLFPSDIAQSEKLKSFKHNDIYVVKARKPRTKNYLDQAFAILNFLYDNWRDEPVENIRVFRQMINVIIGNYDIIVINGNIEKITRSWSYSEMDQPEFMKEVYNPLMDFACQYMDMERDKLIESSLEYAGIDYQNNKKNY